jgi:hypothetical protein
MLKLKIAQINKLSDNLFKLAQQMSSNQIEGDIRDIISKHARALQASLTDTMLATAPDTFKVVAKLNYKLPGIIESISFKPNFRLTDLGAVAKLTETKRNIASDIAKLNKEAVQEFINSDSGKPTEIEMISY